MSFQLEKDVDHTWVTGDFGTGLEEYKITHYDLPIVLELMKKHGHRDKYADIWQHRKTDAKVFVEPKSNPGDFKRLEKQYVKNEYDLTDVEALALRQEAICIVLLDWKPGVILDKEGKPAGCGQKEKEQLVIDSPARVQWILMQGQKIANFFPDMEQAAGKSARPSNSENGADVKKSNSQTAENVSK